MTSPVERISGPRIVSTSGKRLNGSTASFTATCAPSAGGRSKPSARSSSNVAPSITRAATLASGTPVALLTNGTVRLARGFASITYTVSSFTAYCTLHSPTTSSAPARSRVWASIRAHDVTRERRRRDRARGVARVHARFFDVFHHAADHDFAGAVAQRVDIDLGRVLQEAVDERGPLGREAALAPERTRSR